jgi:uncharacterized membrane protein
MTFIDPRNLLVRATRSLWFTPAVYAALAMAVLGFAPLLGPLLPDEMMQVIGLDGVYDLLSVLANTLLAVAIFSLGIMASSMQVAANAATPRARPLLMKDRTAQNAISTFIGGFIFSVVGIVGLSTSYYNDDSRVVLFFATCVVILAVILALIRWIGRLSDLGDVAEVIDLAETATSGAFAELAHDPNLGGVAGEEPAEGVRLFPRRFGFVQGIDTEKLGELAAAGGQRIHLLVRPGQYVDPEQPLLITATELDDEAADALRETIVIVGDRSFEADPRFGLIVLSEIGSRALSSGVNDPGTAIDVIGTSVRALAKWSDAARGAEPEVRFPHLHVVPLRVEDVLEDAFRWIARDGAGLLEVQIRLQKGLATLARHDPALFGPAARQLSLEALERAELAMDLPQDMERLRTVAARLD